MKPFLERLSDVAVLAIQRNSLVTANVDEFKQALDELLPDTAKVVVDLSAVRFIDSAGCGALLQSHARLRDRGGWLRVCGVLNSVRALFELVRIQRVLNIFPDRQQALLARSA